MSYPFVMLTVHLISSSSTTKTSGPRLYHFDLPLGLVELVDSGSLALPKACARKWLHCITYLRAVHLHDALCGITWVPRVFSKQTHAHVVPRVYWRYTGKMNEEVVQRLRAP